MFKPIMRGFTAALIAATVALAITAAPAAKGHQTTQAEDAGQTLASVTTNRLRVPLRGSACSRQGWPNFESKCQFDLREPAGEARAVRVIALR